MEIAGLKEEIERGNYGSTPACTAAGDDIYATGDKLKCCNGKEPEEKPCPPPNYSCFFCPPLCSPPSDFEVCNSKVSAFCVEEFADLYYCEEKPPSSPYSLKYDFGKIPPCPLYSFPIYICNTKAADYCSAQKFGPYDECYDAFKFKLECIASDAGCCPPLPYLGESLGDWKPIPKKDLKCSGSDYVKCLDAYIRPDGVWVLDDYAPWGPKDPECIDWPQSAEQLCNECAGGCIDGDCSTDGQNFCKPPCTGSYEDPYASGKNVPCCDGLEEQLNTWDRDGKYYYKCMDKDAWKPIKQDLKCSGSDYFKCLNAYIRPYDGVWVLEEPDPRGGPPDPECTNWPKTNEQLCNACAGGCAEVCSTDGSTFCNPPKN